MTQGQGAGGHGSSYRGKGLRATLMGAQCQTTSEAIKPCCLQEIKQHDFHRLYKKNQWRGQGMTSTSTQCLHYVSSSKELFVQQKIYLSAIDKLGPQLVVYVLAFLYKATLQ